MQVQSLGEEDPLEEGMETHTSILAWKIPQTEEPSGLQPIASESDTTEATQHARMEIQGDKGSQSTQNRVPEKTKLHRELHRFAEEMLLSMYIY